MADQGRVVATEEFQYVVTGDAVTVSASVKRRVRGSDGTLGDFIKRMSLTADALDFGLRSYTSNLEFDKHIQVKGVVPGDTAMTVYGDLDGAGTADRLVQPPGRLFIMDPGMFTLFDVISRNLRGKPFKTRPINIVALGETTVTVEAMVTDMGADTLLWGSRRTPTRKLKLSDPSGDFTVWSGSKGQLIRLEHAASDLVVMREPDALPVKPASAVKKAPAKKPAGAATR